MAWVVVPALLPPASLGGRISGERNEQTSAIAFAQQRNGLIRGEQGQTQRLLLGHQPTKSKPIEGQQNT